MGGRADDAGYAGWSVCKAGTPAGKRRLQHQGNRDGQQFSQPHAAVLSRPMNRMQHNPLQPQHHIYTSTPCLPGVTHDHPLAVVVRHAAAAADLPVLQAACKGRGGPGREGWCESSCCFPHPKIALPLASIGCCRCSPQCKHRSGRRANHTVESSPIPAPTRVPPADRPINSAAGHRHRWQLQAIGSRRPGRLCAAACAGGRGPVCLLLLVLLGRQQQVSKPAGQQGLPLAILLCLLCHWRLPILCRHGSRNGSSRQLRR